LVNTVITTIGNSLTNHPSYGTKNLLKDLLSSEDPENDKSLGAEINSLISLLKSEQIDENLFLYLIISDTDDGEYIGNVLKEFFSKHPTYKFNTIKIIKVKYLDNTDFNNFRTKGLRNFVRELTKIYKRHSTSIVLNVTAGFKPMTSFALSFAFTMKLQTFYRFFSFNKIIKLPPMPIAFNIEPWLRHKDLIDALESEGEMSQEQLSSQILDKFDYNNLSQDLKMLIDVETVDNVNYYALNPVGEIYTFAVRQELQDYEKTVRLKHSKVPVEKKFLTNSSEAHVNEFINNYKSIINKLIELPFIKKVKTTGFSSIYDKKSFTIKKQDKYFKAVYSNKGGSLYMIIETTARNSYEDALIIEKIREIFD
jgi:putative CRISPR-associated protein (TIGR02619 family)